MVPNGVLAPRLRATLGFEGERREPEAFRGRPAKGGGAGLKIASLKVGRRFGQGCVGKCRLSDAILRRVRRTELHMAEGENSGKDEKGDYPPRAALRLCGCRLGASLFAKPGTPFEGGQTSHWRGFLGPWRRRRLAVALATSLGSHLPYPVITYAMG
jgi:hypothetical protein